MRFRLIALKLQYSQLPDGPGHCSQKVWKRVLGNTSQPTSYSKQPSEVLRYSEAVGSGKFPGL